MKKIAPQNTEDKLDVIILHLERMDRRDRIRMIGGFFRSILGLLPILLTLFALWYTYNHGDELLEKITKQAAQEAANITTESAGSIVRQFENVFPK
ncbi:MAG: hypothetical protein O2904_02665 [bacterium]|nr:hypothetical protein [bacterium]